MLLDPNSTPRWNCKGQALDPVVVVQASDWLIQRRNCVTSCSLVVLRRNGRREAVAVYDGVKRRTWLSWRVNPRRGHLIAKEICGEARHLNSRRRLLCHAPGRGRDGGASR